MMSWFPINWELARNPYNWVVIFLMVVIAGMALHLIFSHVPLPTTEDTP